MSEILVNNIMVSEKIVNLELIRSKRAALYGEGEGV